MVWILLSIMEMTSKCLSFEHSDDISVVDNIKIVGKLLSICFVFVFYNNFDRLIWRPIPLKFLGKLREREREKQIAPSSRCFHGLYSYQP